jgi:hypothetical protein
MCTIPVDLERKIEQRWAARFAQPVGEASMTQSQGLSSAIPPAPFERPACPRCKAQMMLVSIEPERLGVDLHMFHCAVCNHVLATRAAHKDPMHSQALGRWLLGDLHPAR